ncbi:hypothetical protein [Kineococcus radiotolerans]|uniref:Uncharacterized protein n=1 Tax=Kineococcus radiotolerans (strain ATCC BAA-149 / DSM 14245 / SRS30216) TaxID=266940 RepID=A6W8W8_KINRD|nr:hypothetical protein [Kineococcus radiotolerans]ABS03257.1 hypothetical protein Krad_1771 [Kineococcus radiotolerans SRS30216 = ATCC BAA-149]
MTSTELNTYQLHILAGLNREAKHVYAGFETTTDDLGREVLTERGAGQRNRRDARRVKNRLARASRKANR